MRIRCLILFRPVVAVFIESFGEGRQLVIGAESPRRRPHRSLLHLAARRFIRAMFARVESGKQGWCPPRGRERESGGRERRNIALLANDLQLYFSEEGAGGGEGGRRKVASTAGAASRARRGVYASATAANYVSTELNLKDHRREERRRARDLRRASRLDLSATTRSRQRDAAGTIGAAAPGRTGGQVEIAWGWYLCRGLIPSATLDNRDANN